MLPRILVTLQFLIGAALVLTARPNLSSLGWHLLTVSGVLLSLWAIAAIGWRRVSVMPQARDDAELKTSGPYRYVRHPMYSGLLLFCCGLVFTPWHWWKLAAFVGLVLVLALKSRIEERLLAQRFPAYPDYARTTKRFVPFVW
ncbi:MAG: isoprenylcysteine carboxylmethyltransferase family protein [Planctomycetaceae bacterium]